MSNTQEIAHRALELTAPVEDISTEECELSKKIKEQLRQCEELGRRLDRLESSLAERLPASIRATASREPCRSERALALADYRKRGDDR